MTDLISDIKKEELQNIDNFNNDIVSKDFTIKKSFSEPNVLKSDREEKNKEYEYNTEKYVVSLDSVPQFYTSTEEKAMDYMWDMIRALQLNYSSFISFIHTPFNSFHEIHLVARSKLFIISYDTVVHKLQIHKISEEFDKYIN